MKPLRALVGDNLRDDQKTAGISFLIAASLVMKVNDVSEVKQT